MASRASQSIDARRAQELYRAGLGLREELSHDDESVEDFVFDDGVAAVFDDMLERSVPFYGELQRLVVELSTRFLTEDGAFYDIGCSTGNTLLGVATAIDPRRAVRFVGLEPSPAMRTRALAKLGHVEAPDRIEIVPHSVEAMEDLPDARVITILYTLQFVRPVHRPAVLRMCHQSLLPGGCLILAEKILADDPALRRIFIDLYHGFKRRRGYSSTEITRKREALENVLVPFTDSENLTMLHDAGFATVEPVFKWLNFAAYVAVKP
jgi:tRNA (cmo5U34)-methyltransferase